MALAHKIKTLDDRIKANKAQNNLDRETAEISTLLSGQLDKYEYLSSQDLAPKPELIEKKTSVMFSVSSDYYQGVKKDDKVKKYKHCDGLFYNSMHNFNKYSEPRFNKISSIVSKFNTINKFYSDFAKKSQKQKQ